MRLNLLSKLLLTLVAGFGLPFAVSAQMPEPYTWRTMSQNSSGSMPCGGGDVGLNVWVERGDVLFYAARSGFFDENNTMLKAGRFRLRLDGGLDPASFRQTLNLTDGNMVISDGVSRVSIEVDVFHPVVHVSVVSSRPRNVSLGYETWRHHNRQIRGLESQQCSYKFGAPKEIFTHADSLKPSSRDVWFYHVNPGQTVFNSTMAQQQLQMSDSLFDPIGSLVFGGRMKCDGLKFTGISEGVYASTDYRAYNFSAPRAARSASFTIALGMSKDGVEAFKEAVGEAEKLSTAKSLSQSRDWWRQYWQRSYVKASGRYADICRNYELFRYMLGCNAFSQWPTKFNGGLFTFDPVYINPKYDYTPDFRRWGGGLFTAQNQRLVYWPMLKNGDSDLLQPQLDFYLRLLPVATLRSRTYWGHEGANFNEQIENFGLPNRDEYGRKRPEWFDPGVERNAWLEYTWDTVLEFCMMALEWHRYTGTDISRYMPLIEQSVLFFDEHYRREARLRGSKELDGDGHLIIYPGSALETFKMAYNPANTVAALKTLGTALVSYLKTNADSAETAKYQAILNRVPDLPYRYLNGKKCIAPASVWARVNNREIPQLYPLFPWRMFGVWHDPDSVVINTWRNDPYVAQFKGITSWEQSNIFAACLGLTAEADSLERLKMGNGSFRFPAFWGPGHDWAPDHNWGGSGMIGIQEMLLQEKPDGGLILFPAWPHDVDASFRLHASGGRTVDAEIRNGRITSRVSYDKQ